MARKTQENRSSLVGITEIVERYLPMSKRKARRFVKMYLNPIWIGNSMYVDRELLKALLDGLNGNQFPLNNKPVATED